MDEVTKIPVSLCLPAFNEEPNIKKAIYDSMLILDRISDDWEIIVINDGSLDKTAAIVTEISKREDRVSLISHQSNKGYGAALITGFYSSKKDWVWLSAADNQFDPAEIFKLLPFANDYDAVAGYRYSRQDPLYRRMYARVYNGLIKIMLGIRAKDINCGFKLIRRGVFDKIRLESNGALIDAEFFARCRQAGFSIKEVAVGHKPREFGKQTGGNLVVVIRMFVELFKLRSRIR